MFPKERRKEILQIVNATGFATVEDLARRFGVSVDSIRKDLKQLQREGKIQREYGGALRIEGAGGQDSETPNASTTSSGAQTTTATGLPASSLAAQNSTNSGAGTPAAPVPSGNSPTQNQASALQGSSSTEMLGTGSGSKQTNGEELLGASQNREELLGAPQRQKASSSIWSPIAQSLASNRKDKADAGRKAVAARAYMELNDGDAIFLGISRTNLYLADLIKAGDKRLIVTTNMLDVLPRLSGNPKVTALATGGYLNALQNGFTGTPTISLLEPLLFTKVFLGAYGVNLDNNAVLAMTSDDASLNERVLQNGSYKFLLVDSEKFNIHGGVRYASVPDFTAVITDSRDTKIMQRIVSTGTPVLV